MMKILVVMLMNKPEYSNFSNINPVDFIDFIKRFGVK